MDETIKPIRLRSPFGIRFLDYNEIIMIKAEGNNCIVHTKEKDKPVRVLCNLAYLQKNFCNKILYRCHKSYIINLHYIEEVLIKSREILLKDSIKVRISERCLREIRKIID
ncbi:MAG: LytTR family transcriptional regulator [Bacteroidales bacterium]|nr:LytTR family transcriptional regulator [Bacteroidales bacterium]